MKKEIQIMPFQLLVRKYRPFHESPYYTKNGEHIFMLESREHTARYSHEDSYITFDDSLFLEVISVKTIEDAEKFFASHPDLRIIIEDNSVPASLSGDAYFTLDSYYRKTAEVTRLYVNLYNLWLLIKEQEAHPSLDHREKIRETYCLVFPWVFRRDTQWESFFDMADDIYSQCEEQEDDQEAEDEEAEDEEVDGSETEENANYLLEGQLPIEGFPIEGFVDEKEREYYRTISPEAMRADSIIAGIMRDEIDAFVSSILSTITTFYSIKEKALQCRCPDLLRAMFMMRYVAFHNEDEYRECAEPHCHRMFKVNKPPHEQSRCDIHMKNRQRKREGQKLAGKNFPRARNNKPR